MPHLSFMMHLVSWYTCRTNINQTCWKL